MDLTVSAVHDTACKKSRKQDGEDNGIQQQPPSSSSSSVDASNTIPAHQHTDHPMMDVVSSGDSSVNVPVFNGDPQNNALDLTSHHESNEGGGGGGTIASPNTSNIHSEPVVSLSHVTFMRVLNENAKNKTLTFEGSYKESPVVVVLEKTPFSEDGVRSMVEDSEAGGSSSLEKEFVNDIYGKYCLSSNKSSEIRTTIIHPATAKHIEKYSRQDVRLVRETAVLYNSVTLPFISSSQFNLDWVYNILDHKSERERIVFEDNHEELGFILLPDMKWDTKDVKDLYLVAIIRKKGIKSLRDLTPEHLPLLNNIFKKGVDSIQERYGLHQDQLRIYIHYHPSYYHFHVHFTAVSFDAPGCLVERAHLLSSVIDNITLFPNYYQNTALTFPVPVNDSLYKAFHPTSV